MDVFVVGEPAGSPHEFADPKLPTTLRVIPTGVATCDELGQSGWAEQICNGETELAAIVAGSDRESLVQAYILALSCDGQATSKSVVSLEVERIDPGWREDPTGISLNGFRIFLAPRATLGSVVFRRSAFERTGPLRPVAEPVWDWVLRAAIAGETISSTPIPPIPGERIPAFGRLPHLVPDEPGAESGWLREQLKAYAAAKFPSTRPGKRAITEIDEIAFRAGLFQWHDFLNESHELSQSIEGQGVNQLGDYWHAIMHRREPDYSNAKYWFRRIGNQPIYRDLRQYADSVLEQCPASEAPRWRQRLTGGPKWDPFAFVDMCEECAQDETSDLALAARRIQYAEMSLLM